MLKSRSFKVLAVIAGILVVVLIVSSLTNFSLLSSLVNLVTSPLNEAAHSSDSLGMSKTKEELIAENEQLREELNSLRAKLVEYDSLKQDNIRLWKYYDLKLKNPSYEFMPAAVIRRDPNENFYSFTADKGTLSGVSVNDPVITENGLIGWVFRVDATSCLIKTILSPDTRVGAIDNTTRDSGVISGGVRFADDNLTMLTKLSAKNTIKKGDIIVTSGIGGIFPPDIPVGEAEEVKLDEYDTSFYAIVKPFEDIRSVQDVVIITDFTGQGQISTKNVSPPTTVPATTVQSTTQAATEAEE